MFPRAPVVTHVHGTFIPGMWKHLRPVLLRLPCGSHPPLWQEELEFAIMRIEALKLARQIALASRSRRDAQVRFAAAVQCLLGMSCGPRAALLTDGQAGPAGVRQKAGSGTLV